MSFFSLPLHPWQLQQSTLTSKKRKPSSEGSESGFPDSEDVSSFRDGPSNTPSAAGFPLQTYPVSSDHFQRRFAGLGPDDPLPRAPYPHAPDSYGKSNRRKYINAEEELQNLNPPLYLPESFARHTSLRTQHFAVISTIFHRCLLEGDYVRASRAWGMILRDEFGGEAVDIRTDGRWGLGAEILLHRRAQIARERSSTRGDEELVPESAADSFNPDNNSQPLWFTKQGFQDAKDYYDRLILQYPFDITRAKSTSALDFYPAMFGLWIYIIQAEAKAARDEEALTAAEQDLVRQQELKDAQEIASRLDQLMISPPYSDYGELLRLRGMVALWIGDLQVPLIMLSTAQGDSGGMEVDGDSAYITDNDDNERKKQEQIVLARRFFEDARRRGTDLPPSIESL